MSATDRGLFTDEAAGRDCGRLSGAFAENMTEDALRLAASLSAGLSESGGVVLISGLERSRGVSTIARQVSLALARMNVGSVLLVDGDLRRPDLHRRFEATGAPGFLDVLAGRARVEEAVRRGPLETLNVLTTEQVSTDGSHVTDVGRLALALDSMKRQHRFVIVDGSPLMESVDSTLVAAHADRVVLVVGLGREERQQVLEAKRILDGVNANLFGVVLSDWRRREGGRSRLRELWEKRGRILRGER